MKPPFYYLIYEFSEVKIKESYKTHFELKRLGYDIRGRFGRLDYAEIWRNYYNGEITQAQFRKELNRY